MPSAVEQNRVNYQLNLIATVKVITLGANSGGGGGARRSSAVASWFRIDLSDEWTRRAERIAPARSIAKDIVTTHHSPRPAEIVRSD